MNYRFLNFELDAGNRELLHGGRSIRLSALNFTLLQVLVENPGKVFSREELIERVWPGRIVTAVLEADGTWLSYYHDETGKLYAVDRAGTWYYVGTDHLGSPRVVADAGGTVVKIVDYSAFGEVLGDSNPALELHIGFAGGLREPTGPVSLGPSGLKGGVGGGGVEDLGGMVGAGVTSNSNFTACGDI